MFDRILAFFLDYISFFAIPYPVGLRLRLVANYFRMLFKSSLFGNSLHFESFLGYDVVASRYKYIFGIFKITFFKGQYYFRLHKKHPLIIDCGANIWVSTLFFHFLFPDAEIHTFEPNPTVFGYLKQNTVKFWNIHNHQLAVSEQSGSIDFFVDNADIGDTNASVKQRTNRVLSDSITIDAIRLSDFIKTNLGDRTIDFIKFNIEWAEDGVIEEMANNGALKYVDRIIFEYHHHIEVWAGSRLARLLARLEENWMDYVFSVTNFRLYREGATQNLFIYAYKRGI